MSGTTRMPVPLTGACWAVIKVRLGQYLFGLYPDGEQWRINVGRPAGVAGIAPMFLPR